MLIEVENLRFSYIYSDFKFLEKALLQDICFNVESGTMLHVTGNNGSGKTTLLRLLAGILAPCMGDIKYQQNSIYKNSSEYQNAICYVGHKLGLNMHLSAVENCYFDLKNQKSKQQIIEILEEFELARDLHTPCQLLSAGQKKRISLLRILLSNTKVWILDEPFTALDSKYVKIFMKCIAKHVASSGVVIYTSHQAIDLNNIQHIEYNL